MTTLKTLPLGISPAKIKQEKVIIDACCFDDLKHPYYSEDTECIKDHCLQDIVGLDTEFMYSAFCFGKETETDSGTHGEVGLGRLTKEDDQVILLRESAIFYQNEDSGRVPPQNDNEINQGFFEEDSNLLISVFQTDPLDSHLIQNTLFYNGGYVKLTDEGILCSLDGHLIKFSPQDLVKFISRSSANISTGPISIKPLKTRPSRVKKGTVIFNEIKSKLEVYDGTEWKTLKWED